MEDGNLLKVSANPAIDEYRRLRKRDDLFRVVGDSAADGLAVMQDEIVVDCNSRLEALFGRSRKNILGYSPWDFGERTPEERAAAERRARRLIARAYSGEVVRSEWEHRRTDGGLQIHEVTLSRFELDDGPRLLCWVRDVTSAVATQSELVRRVDFQSRVVEISNRLVGTPADVLGEEIRQVIGIVAARHDIDCASVWALDRRRSLAYGILAVGFESNDTIPVIRDPSGTPWINEQLFAGAREPIRVPDDLPSQAERDRRFFADKGIRSVLVIPHALRENLVGLASLGMRDCIRDWSDEEIIELQLLFQTIGSAWSRFLFNYGATQREADLKRSQRVAGVGSFQIIRQDDGPLSWNNARLLQSAQADFIRDVPCCAQALCALLDKVHPDDRSRVSGCLENLDERDGAILEYRLVRPDGEVLHVEERFELDLDDTGAIDQIFGTIKDITTQIRSTERLRLALDEIQTLKDQLEIENFALREEVRVARGFQSIIGGSEALRSAMRAAEKVAPTDISVLIQGETGTGKELFARSIHEISNRHKGPMISVNCAALSSDLIESELFGHERGAFTDAVSSRRGRFELAHGGTLFLDEIGELPLAVQAKLLRVLQTGDFERLGGTKTLAVDVRVIAATNRNLSEMVAAGTFRDDLYYRINHFLIELPALRDRPEDIPVLANHFLARHARQLSRDVRSISSAMLDDMMARPWPGNVRELEAHIQRALIAATGPVLDYRPDDAGGRTRLAAESQHAEPDLTLETMQRRHITEALDSCGWVVDGDSGAAAILGLPPSSLRSRMKRLGINRKSGDTV